MNGENGRATVHQALRHMELGDWSEDAIHYEMACGLMAMSVEYRRDGCTVLANDFRDRAIRHLNKIKVTPVPAGVRPPVTLASTGVGLPGRHHPALVGDPAFREGPVSPNLKEVGQ